MPTNLDLARPISSAVEIGTISLRDANVRSRLNPFSPPPEDIYLRQNFRASYELGGTDSVMVQVELNFEAGKNDPDEAPESLEPVVALSATFGVTYYLQGIANFEADALQAFAELNGPYSAWPYWRELVHSVAGRVGLATIVIPVFKVPVREIEPKEAKPAARARRAPRRKKAE